MLYTFKISQSFNGDGGITQYQLKPCLFTIVAVLFSESTLCLVIYLYLPEANVGLVNQNCNCECKLLFYKK